MRNRIGGWAWRRLLPAVALLTAVPGLAQGDWNQAYGDIGNSSFVNVATDIGVRPLWSVQLNGPVAWGGPAIGRGETVYLGTTNGAPGRRFPLASGDLALACADVPPASADVPLAGADLPLANGDRPLGCRSMLLAC
jgi:hypothetical protein